MNLVKRTRFHTNHKWLGSPFRIIDDGGDGVFLAGRLDVPWELAGGLEEFVICLAHN